MRLFVAVAMPGSVDPIIDAAIDPWRDHVPGARWVPSEDRHVTLKFLGDVDPSLQPWVHRRVREIADAAGSFPISLDSLGAFPSPRRARIVWAGVRDSDSRLAALASGLDASLESTFATEQRPFTAHVTIARCDPPRSLSDELASTPLTSAPFTVDEMVLMRSHPPGAAGGRASGMPAYEVLGSFPLRSGTAGP